MFLSLQKKVSMKIISKMSRVLGQVRVPGSKSHTIRGLILGLLAEGRTRLSGALLSEDTLSALRGVEGLSGQVVIWIVDQQNKGS